MRNLTNLDFMRSIAVLLVVTAHMLVFSGHRNADGWSGITGVCIFFVHTSLVLMWSLERDPEVGRFYLRRIFRLYPLWLTVLALVVLTRLPQLPSFIFFPPSAKAVLMNALLVSNLWSGTAIVGASWTLPIEAQMYVFLPVLFFFARGSRLLWPLLCVDLFIMTYDAVNLPHFNSSLLMCIPYFLPGVMAYVLSKRTKLQRLPGWCFPCFLFALVAIDHRFGTFRRSWAFCLVLGLALPLFREMTSRPVRVASHYVARYSYGIYLTHVPIIVITFYYLRNEPLLVRAAVFVVLLILAPVVLYHTIEEPMIRLGAKFAHELGKRPGPRATAATFDMEPAP